MASGPAASDTALAVSAASDTVAASVALDTASAVSAAPDMASVGWAPDMASVGPGPGTALVASAALAASAFPSYRKHRCCHILRTRGNLHTIGLDFPDNWDNHSMPYSLNLLNIEKISHHTSYYAAIPKELIPS